MFINLQNVVIFFLQMRINLKKSQSFFEESEQVNINNNNGHASINNHGSNDDLNNDDNDIIIDKDKIMNLKLKKKTPKQRKN